MVMLNDATDGWMVFFLLSIMILGIIGLGYTFVLGKRQNRKDTGNLDDDPSPNVVKHHILLNPIFMIYIFSIIVMFAGGYMFYLFLF